MPLGWKIQGVGFFSLIRRHLQPRAPITARHQERIYAQSTHNRRALRTDFQTTLGVPGVRYDKACGGYRPRPGFRLVPRDGVSYLVSYATREATARRKELEQRSHTSQRTSYGVIESESTENHQLGLNRSVLDNKRPQKPKHVSPAPTDRTSTIVPLTAQFRNL